MKRFLSVAASLSLLLSLTACAGNTEGGSSSPVTFSTTESTSNAAESTASAPESTASAPESTTSTHESTTSTHESTASAPESTASTPESTASAPESTASAPESTASAPESTASAPESTASTPESTASASESTASAPVSTTGAPDKTEPTAKPTLSNPNASPEAVRLYEYIADTYGNAIISGQQESTWMGSEQYEFDYIYENTGKYPAIRGLDYMNDDFEGVNRRAKEWHDRGGIVTICWHCGFDFSGSWDECMKTERKNWDQALMEGTPEYDELIEQMDKGAKALKELKEANIAVLWRPFHELDGGWFWWSKGGADSFKELWRIMYRRYTEYWELDNLIWVLGYSGNGKGYDKWYPGDDYVDIAGADSYNDGANQGLYKKVLAVVGEEMPICFHECGRIPTVKQLKDGKADWVWFMTWHTEHITDHNRRDDLNAIYNDEYVITLDELPPL